MLCVQTIGDVRGIGYPLSYSYPAGFSNGIGGASTTSDANNKIHKKEAKRKRVKGPFTAGTPPRSIRSAFTASSFNVVQQDGML
jgi:hypothetical protein